MTSLPLSSTPDQDAADQAPPYTLFTANGRRYIIALVALAGWFSTLSFFISSRLSGW